METPKSKRVMVAVDDTEVSAYAFQWALGNFISEGDYVIVLSAAPYLGIDYPNADMASEYGVPMLATPQDAERAEKKVTGHSKQLVNKYLDMCRQKNIACEGEVVKGDAGSWIVDEGERVAADAIVVGSNAHGLLARTILGSISDYVLHNSPCTVVVVRQSEDALCIHDPLSSQESRKVVIAVDDSKEAIYAFTWALKFFCKPSDNVILYHVHHPYVQPITGSGTGEFGIEEVYIPPDVSAKDEVESLKESQKVVEKFMAFANHESKIKCEGIVRTGQTEAKVIEGLISLKADAVVVGTHEKGAVARTFLGSVSDHLAHNSPCPLIVAKAKKEATIAFDVTPPEHETNNGVAKHHST
ncbi:hypothetical protein MPTK2_7g10800 [Marchantia polymorpha subsp. ruderalis]